MADIAIFRINYKSDFILTLQSDAGWMTPFCIKFWTGAPSQAYFVGFDGTTYTHCAPVDGEPTKLLVQFDDHHLPIGDLKFQIGYHFTVADFPTSVEDEVLNQASVIIEVDDVPAQVMLDLNGETAPEIEFSLPAYANEAQRIANEEARIEAEQQRITDEDARIQAEEIRQYNEQQRIQHEEYRVSEFATLKSQSQAATSAANAAATLANEKAQLAADKAALAQAAATLANEKAQLAADKAALAAAAATLANDKATLAQQKAAYAQAQGDYAKAQGDYAKAQGDTAQADHERAEADHTTAATDHQTAAADHTTAASDHSRAEADHTTASSDHTRAESDHTTASSDHTRAESDHTTAASDHTCAESDHTTAAADHTTAQADHTRAESDHTAVEMYVDSLGVFDLSKHNAVGGVLATYADLDAALNALNALDSKYKYGGMSFKFVQSSDNKYVQFRYMGTSTAAADFTNVENWYNDKEFIDNLQYMQSALPYQSRLLEAYFIGLNLTKSYYFKYLRWYESGSYKIVQIHLYEVESDVRVAVAEYRTDSDFLGIIKLEMQNNSGIEGYVLVNIHTVDTTNFSNRLNLTKASVIDYSPMIKEYLNRHLTVEDFNKYIVIKSPFSSVSSDKVYKRCPAIILYGLNSTHTYSVSALRHFNYSGYECAEIKIKDTTANEVVALAQIETTNDYYGCVEIVERNNSGVTGNAIINIASSDTDNVTAVIDIEKITFPVKIKANDAQHSDIADKIPEIKVATINRLGNSTHDGSGAFSNIFETTVAAFSEQIATKNAILSILNFRPKGNHITFGLGMIDQRNIAVIRKTFGIDCVAEQQNIIDITSKGILINEGETLFVIFDSRENSICFRSNDSVSTLQMVYGAINDALIPYPTEYGGRLNLYWETKEIESPFALNEELKEVSNKTETATEMAQQALSNFSLVKDRQGNYYQLVVVNGTLSVIPLVYKKVLVICNSIGINGRVYSQGWCSERGMASSRNGLDYKTHLENGLKEKDNTSQVVLRNVWNWEQDFDSITPAQLMSGYLTNDVDCIIFRAGENIPNDRNDITENVVDLLEYCISQCPNANVCITSMVWEKSNHNQALLQAANELGVPFIDVLSTTPDFRERIGDYLEGDYTSDDGTTWDTTQQVLYKVTGNGVANHTNDVGMLRIANNILSALKYEPLDLLHNLIISEKNGHTCSIITDKWVKDGIVNVVSDGTVSVVDSDNNTVSVTNHNDGVFTFTMPSKDVTISVS